MKTRLEVTVFTKNGGKKSPTHFMRTGPQARALAICICESAQAKMMDLQKSYNKRVETTS